MAQFFKPKPKRTKQLSPRLPLQIEQLDHLGAGISQHQGKVVFIPNTLPGEDVIAQLVEQKKSYARGRVIEITKQSPDRVQPACEYYGQCGGCDMQHLHVAKQRQHKQKALADIISRAIKQDIVKPSIIEGDAWGYRRRARLATKYNKKSKRLSLGFRAPQSNDVIAIQHCKVLMPSLSQLIAPLSELLNTLACRTSIGHVELTAAKNGLFIVLRITQDLRESDESALEGFAREHDVALWLQQDDGLCIALKDTTAPQEAASSIAQAPFYEVALASGQHCKLEFSPGNFIQVNGEMNQLMIAQAVKWLALQPGERVLDLFCGVGNFSVALAQFNADVVGVEGVPAMVAQAKINAAQNHIGNLEFFHADLSRDLNEASWLGKIDKLLLDPARAGAYEVLHQLEQMQPKKVVYVSCNPASLARDAQVLIEQGYQLKQLSMLDMFPQTHHIEAIALFER
ncbi:23S rRNA (uracil(1939)-C(5))-methyltransferase RlmD [Shewanella gelidii]|uniref:23S rRNA (uracil(1939)-C(5))-methyltransferase RlmD n=1 Tax=Shewanella gelidii TaxID=1642821 RepID=A0A917JHJ4_9GAMM|nr:23S rRNA (uracil(1939)-C(5))-methyltransferase RlmD [Shewanella gelidii]MCL1096596.1 23S rRNA (uracil(1939)-C(5))-methyltransferase RlmD [Shewanella gelidii]GGI68717.1 23S rRNA (uracil(1939)-C(5))-methyltransferase RlmD [Shewanella gelidii]